MMVHPAPKKNLSHFPIFNSFQICMTFFKIASFVFCRRKHVGTQATLEPIDVITRSRLPLTHSGPLAEAVDYR